MMNEETEYTEGYQEIIVLCLVEQVISRALVGKIHDGESGHTSGKSSDFHLMAGVDRHP